LITPDRTLSRQVAAHLDRWGIEPDDSAGRPLIQSAPGRFLMQLAGMMGQRVEAEALAILMAHPLTRAGADRSDHLARARALELSLLRGGPCPFPDRAAVMAWAESAEIPSKGEEWVLWIAGLLDDIATSPTGTLSGHVARHRMLAERLCAGDGTLWDGPAGRVAEGVMDALEQAAPEMGGAAMSVADYTRILHALLSAEEVRDAYSPHPDVMIWGALEARVRTADLVILGGLTDGVWPDQPGVDPWLNRAMRMQCGLRLPDRSIGLSAHDFQQAAAGPEVWLSRSLRDAEAETVPSRWLNRIEGLLHGIGGAAAQALADMRGRGNGWLALAAELTRPDGRVNHAPRPAPVPPRVARPNRLSVTAIETLIRDPYAIYARYILGLRPLPPLRQGPDARVRGIVVHEAMERFARDTPGPLSEDAVDRLRHALETTLEEETPWPAMRRIWLGKFERLLPDLAQAEAGRRAIGAPLFLEEQGMLPLPGLDFTLTAKADRIDLRGDAVAIYDYKTGTPPTPKQQETFAKQLLLEAVMVEDGAFDGIARRRVEEVAYLQVGSRYDERRVKIDPDILTVTRAGLRDLIAAYANGRPYTARLAPDLIAYESDYDHLSRRGEWADTDTALRIPVGE
ncbi:MAG: double-strand break repair protein AddB, partial [Jannaschia sp.]